MTLIEKEGFWYGTSSEDLRAVIIKYSRSNSYEAEFFASSTCECGGKVFGLESDEEEGVARRTCTACGQGVFMGDSEAFATAANLERHVCICDGNRFELQSQMMFGGCTSAANAPIAILLGYLLTGNAKAATPLNFSRKCRGSDRPGQQTAMAHCGDAWSALFAAQKGSDCG